MIYLTLEQERKMVKEAMNLLDQYRTTEFWRTAEMGHDTDRIDLPHEELAKRNAAP